MPIARNPNTCGNCGGAIAVGEQCGFDLKRKRLIHAECQKETRSKESASDLAARLGFVSFERALHQQWSTMRFLPNASGGNATRRASEARGLFDSLRPVSTSEKES